MIQLHLQPSAQGCCGSHPVGVGEAGIGGGGVRKGGRVLAAVGSRLAARVRGQQISHVEIG